MKSKKQLANSKQIAERIAKWDEETTVAKFFSRKMGENDNANKIAENIISKSLTEEKPEWTRILLDSMKIEDKKGEVGTNLNFFAVASGQINSAIQTLIDVTPKKKLKTGIQNII